jgi:hypothetical protein
MRKGRVIVDGDILAYRAAAANTRRFVKVTHKETAESLEFDTLTKFREWAGSRADQYEVVPDQVAEDIQFAYASMNRSLEHIVEMAGCTEYHIVVSGDNNFRLDLPLPSRYKSNREGGQRPPQLLDCKQYLIHRKGAEVSDGVEADDVLCAYAYAGLIEEKAQRKAGVAEEDIFITVQNSIDKDAKHGPWWLLDHTTMREPMLIEGYGGLTCTERDTGRKTVKGTPVIEKIIKGHGRAFLYFQMAFGDAIDGYKPCELAKVKFGEVGGYELLKHAKNDKEALEALVTRYKLWYPSAVTYRAWDDSLHTKDWLQLMQLYADCAFMRRWPGDRLDIPKLLDKLGVNYKDSE